MNKKASTINWIVLIIILIIVIILLYIFIIKPAQESNELGKSKVYLEALDDNEERKEVNFIIKEGDNIIREGITNEDSLLELYLEPNKTYTLFYKGNPNYYNGWLEFNASDKEIIKISLKKNAQLTINLSDDSIRYGDNELVVRLYSNNGYWVDVIACVDYSFGITYFEAFNFNIIYIIPPYKPYLKCYSFNKDLTPDNPNFFFKVIYTTKEISEYDYIKIVILDRDIEYGEKENTIPYNLTSHSESIIIKNI